MATGGIYMETLPELIGVSKGKAEGTPGALAIFHSISLLKMEY